MGTIVYGKAQSPGPITHSSYLPALKMGKHILVNSLQVIKHSRDINFSIAHSQKYVKCFAKEMLEDAHVTLTVNGIDNFDHSQSYIFMSNHQSLMDIPVIITAVPLTLRMVAKEQLMQIPIFGHAMRSAGFVPIDRKNRQKAITQLEAAKERMREGVSIWIAPEGTRNRSRDNKLQEFKKGGFYLAKDLGAAIVPVWLSGSNQVMQPDSFKVYCHRPIAIDFGEPISTQNLTVDQIMQHVRSQMELMQQSQLC